MRSEVDGEERVAHFVPLDCARVAPRCRIANQLEHKHFRRCAPMRWTLGVAGARHCKAGGSNVDFHMVDPMLLERALLQSTDESWSPEIQRVTVGASA